MRSAYWVAIIGAIAVMAAAIINKCDYGQLSSSQRYLVRGIVLTEGGDPISGVSITINNQSIGVTNNAGNFDYKNENKGDYEIIATKDGYETDRRNYPVSVKNVSIKMKLRGKNSSTVLDAKKKKATVAESLPSERIFKKEGVVTPYIEGKLIRGKDNTYYQLKPD